MIIAQDGYGATTKIEEAIELGFLDGTILSIKYRKPELLPQLITNLLTQYPKLDLFLDTHFYASQIAMTSPGFIPEYQLYKPPLTRRDISDVKTLTNIARKICDYQIGLGLTNIILPGLTLSNFNDINSLVSLQMYRSGIDYLREVGSLTNIKPYLSLAFQESALNDNENLSQFLDELTLFEDIAGFYIVVERENSSYPQWQDSRTLAKLMYVTKTLSQSYKVIHGFTDFAGLNLLASGATGISSGWHQTLRQFTGGYFMKRRGGGNGKFRFPCKNLLSQIISEPDLQKIIQKGFSDEYIDEEFGGSLKDPNNLKFSPKEKALLQWKSLKSLDSQITTSSNPLDELKKLIQVAKNNINTLRESDIVLDRASIAHLEVWENAINIFENGVL